MGLKLSQVERPAFNRMAKGSNPFRPALSGRVAGFLADLGKPGVAIFGSKEFNKEAFG